MSQFNFLQEFRSSNGPLVNPVPAVAQMTAGCRHLLYMEPTIKWVHLHMSLAGEYQAELHVGRFHSEQHTLLI